MAMEVLLRRNIEGVGEVGEIVKVKNGYARNFLLPQGFAAVVSSESLRRVAQDRKAEDVRQARLAEERAEIAERLANVKLTIEARAGEDGHLYGSVGPRQVLAAFYEEGYKFVERHLRFETVRELGQYEATVILGADKQVDVPVWVVQDAADAVSMAEEAARRAEEEAAAEAGEGGDALPSVDDPLDE
ncbi:MAG: 50S ribosomal protein L9 [Planctomycetota bacterium]|nr:50S ribosomal protein L9 [Planctomycetota bacterium]